MVIHTHVIGMSIACVGINIIRLESHLISAWLTLDIFSLSFYITNLFSKWTDGAKEDARILAEMEYRSS